MSLCTALVSGCLGKASRVLSTRTCKCTIHTKHSLNTHLSITHACRRAVKTIIAESCDATNQAKAMGYMTAGWGVGTIVGPTIGGILARPCASFASGLSICNEGSWFAERWDAFRFMHQESYVCLCSCVPQQRCCCKECCQQCL